MKNGQAQEGFKLNFMEKGEIVDRKKGLRNKIEKERKEVCGWPFGNLPLRNQSQRKTTSKDYSDSFELEIFRENLSKEFSRLLG